jgi:hypothetical protein
MANPKLLITAGCSFTQVPLNKTHNYEGLNWPIPLQDYLQCEAIHLGQGAAGNDVISRRAILYLQQSLKKYKADEILLAIMWSGHDRYSFYLERNTLAISEINYGDGCWNYSNPLKINIEAETKRNYITHLVWRDELSKLFYKNLYDYTGSVILTMEHILRTQWFCQANNIRYVFSKYCYDTFPDVNSLSKESQMEVRHLYDMVDWDKWLPMTDAYSWAKHKSSYPMLEQLGNHLSTEQNKEMVDKFFIPHLKSMGYID